MNSSVRRIAPYSCFVVRISSSGRMRERADHGVERRRRVLREHEILGPRSDECGERFTRTPHGLREASREELGRLPLELALPALVLLEHLGRAGAVAAVIEVGDVRIEEKTVPHRRLVSHGARTSPAVRPAASALGLHAPVGRPRERVRERHGRPVHVHLPPQRPRHRPRRSPGSSSRPTRSSASSPARSSGPRSTVSAASGCSPSRS